MAELKCSDGTVIKISDETEAELRKAFGSQNDNLPPISVIKFNNSQYAPRLHRLVLNFDKLLPMTIANIKRAVANGGWVSICLDGLAGTNSTDSFKELSNAYGEIRAGKASLTDLRKILEEK